jgi:DNA-binding NarL/FixJ family response regulator
MTQIRVAIIEDHALTRTGLKSVLDGCAETEWVGDAASAEEGLPLLQAVQPDVAVIDVALPGMNGIEFVQQWRGLSMPGVSLTKLMILTASLREDMVLAGFRSGVDSYCIKTPHPEPFLAALRTTYAGDCWIDPAIARIVLKYFSPPTAAPDNPLTAPEITTLTLVVQGYRNQEIAARCGCSVSTVKAHIRQIMHKLKARDRTQAAVLALQAKWIP